MSQAIIDPAVYNAILDHKITGAQAGSSVNSGARSGCQLADEQPQIRLLFQAGSRRSKSLWVLSRLERNARQDDEQAYNPVRSSELLSLALALLDLSLRPILGRAKALLRVR